jgi:hypothetical protein
MYQLSYLDLIGHNPRMTWKQFIHHPMCVGARNRYELRRFIALLCHRGCNLPNSIQKRRTLYQQLLHKCGVFLAEPKWDSKIGFQPKDMDFSLFEGVSERTFNAVYSNSLTIGKSVPFNNDHQVNHFDKYKAHHIWSNSGEVVDAVTIHFSEDCYTLDENGKLKKDPETLCEIPLKAFSRLHAHNPALVMKLTNMAYGTTKKANRRRYLKRKLGETPIAVVDL